MYEYICDSLKSFQGIFSHKSSWVLFCMVVLGFIGTTEMVGVTSFCRFWGVGESLYKDFLHFFRTSPWSLPTLVTQWGSFVLSQGVALSVQGRLVLIGDHTFVPKDGRQMPGVVSMHQNSETQSKPSYFRAHCWGTIGLVVGSMVAPYCIPLMLAIHLGMIHIGQTQEVRVEKRKETMGTRIVQMAIDFALRHNVPSVLILDAFFPSGAVFKLSLSVWSMEIKKPLVTLIIRAKKNCVGYKDPEPSVDRKSGRKRKYGEKVKLMELFDNLELFSKVPCRVYGKTEEVFLTTRELFWKPFGQKILFVLAVTSRGCLILMCNDLTTDPITALELYCIRHRIEVMIDMLKNVLSIFSYHFWSKKMPRHSRKPKKNKLLKPVPEPFIPTVQQCWTGCEKFVMIGVIGLGLLILTGLKYTDTVWEQFDLYLRTRSRELPSERTVKQVVARLIVRDFLSSAPSAIMQKIRNRCVRKKFIPEG